MLGGRILLGIFVTASFKQKIPILRELSRILSSSAPELHSCLLVTLDGHIQTPCLLPKGLRASQVLP